MVLRQAGEQADREVSGGSEEIGRGNPTDEQQNKSRVFVHGAFESSEEHRYLIGSFPNSST